VNRPPHDLPIPPKASTIPTSSEDDILDDRHIREWIRFACDCNEVPELAQAVLVEWNRRFTRRLGDAAYNSITFRARVRLSTPLWPRASENDRRETVIHEACHLITFYKFGQVAQHGLEWKEAMRNCGLQPERTHSVDRTGLARRQRRFILLDCPSQGHDHKCRMGVREFNLVQRGTVMECKKCGLVVRRESAVEEDRSRAASCQNNGAESHPTIETSSIAE
jgi:SprT protein